MPDWNPAEMIGKAESISIISLSRANYRFIWAKNRKNMDLMILHQII